MSAQNGGCGGCLLILVGLCLISWGHAGLGVVCLIVGLLD